jgi:AbrB family looped-hinge helix DNA binding protein
MAAITITSGFRIVIPKQIRESLKLKPGQKLQAIEYDNRIQLFPFRSAKSMRGFARGIDTRVSRDRNRI